MPPRKRQVLPRKKVKRVTKQATKAAKSLFTNSEVEKFFVSQLDAFAPNLAGVSNTTQCRPCHPYTSHSLFSLSADASQEVLISIMPCLGNNLPFIQAWVGTSTQAATDTVGGSVSAGEHTSYSANAPYAFDVIDGQPATANDVSGRIVSCGLEVNYAGTEYNRGGTIYFLEDEQHGQLTSGTTTVRTAIDNVTGRQNVRRSTFNQMACHRYTVGPIDDDEHNFTDNQNEVYPYAASNSTYNSVSLGDPVAFVYIKPAGALTLNFKLTVHYEFIGKPSQALYRSVYAHPEETQMAISAVAEAKRTHHLAPEMSLLHLGIRTLKSEMANRKSGKGGFLKEALAAASTVGKVGISLAGLAL